MIAHHAVELLHEGHEFGIVTVLLHCNLGILLHFSDDGHKLGVLEHFHHVGL